VGDKEGFGSRLLESLLPLGPIDPTTPVPGPVKMTFAEMIPLGPVGLFADDLPRFWAQPANEFRFDVSFLEIATVGQTVQVVQPKEPRSGDLGTWLDPLWSRGHLGHTEHPILRAIDPGAGPVGESHVPWRSLFRNVSSKAVTENWRWAACPDHEYHFVREWPDFLDGLNGRYRIDQQGFLLRRAGYARLQGMSRM
jgi:hypothetical protein